MPERRPVPVPRRRPHRRPALAAAAVGALVLVPASGAFADDAAPPEEGDATQPLPGDVPLPSQEAEDQVTAGGAPGAPGASADGASADPAADDALPHGESDPPMVSADPAGVADEQAAAALEPYFGVGKTNQVVVTVSADGTEPTAMAGAQVRVDSSDLGNPMVGTHDVIGDGTIDALVPQAPGETLTITLVTPPPGFMRTADTSVVLEPCEVDLPPGPYTTEGGDGTLPIVDEPPACTTAVHFTVVAQYRTVQLRAVTAAGVPVPGVTFELHSPPAALDATSFGAGTAAVVVPGRSLVGTSVTAADGVASLAARVPPGADYLVVPTAVPDGYLLPPSIRLDLGAVDSVTAADVPVVMQFTLVPALAATGTSSWPLSALAAGLLVTGGGLVALRRRLEPVGA